MSDAAIDLARQRKLPIRVNRGEDIDFTLLVKNTDGSDYDFDGYSAELLAYNSFSKTTTPEFTVDVELATGSMRFTREALTSKREDFVYRLWVTDSEGKRKVWTNGDFLILNREWDQADDGAQTLTISPNGDAITLYITPIGSTLDPSALTSQQKIDLVAALIDEIRSTINDA
jgi:hypothetical protein